MKDTMDFGIAKKLSSLAGALIIFMGVCGFAIDIYRAKQFNGNEVDFIIAVLLGMALIIAGIYILRNKKTNVMRDLGLVAFLLGLLDFYNTSNYLIPSITSTTSWIDFVFLGAFTIVTAVDVFIMLFAIRFMLGHRRNAIRLAICFAIPTVFTYISIIMGIGLFWGDFVLFIQSFASYIPSAIVNTVLVIVFLIPSVREEPTEWKTFKISEKMYAESFTEPEASVYRQDLLEFSKIVNDMEKWSDSETVEGAKECALCFGRNRIYHLTLRKMPDSDIIRASVLPVDSKEYIQCMRFDYNCMVPRDGTIYTCKMVRVFGYDGVFIGLRVRDCDPNPENTFLLNRFKSSVKSKFGKKKNTDSA